MTRHANDVVAEAEPPPLQPLEDWLVEPGRSEVFKAFIDSLEIKRRVTVKEIKT